MVFIFWEFDSRISWLHNNATVQMIKFILLQQSEEYKVAADKMIIFEVAIYCIT